MDMSKPPHPEETSFLDEVEKIWGRRWWVDSEFGRLKDVLLYRPGDELKLVDDPIHWLWDGTPDVERAMEEHDNFANILKEEGVRLHYIDERVDRPKMYFMRDQAVVSRGGAIVGRMALDIRRGEEPPVHKKLASMGIPIYRVVTGYGYFEGGNLLYLDKDTVLIGEGLRTNEDGIEQVSEVLMTLRYQEIIIVPLSGYYESFPSGYVHLDVGLNFPDHHLAVVYPESVPYYIIRELIKRNIAIIEVPRDEALNMATNFLAIRPGRILTAAGNDVTRKRMESHGIDVIEVEVRELLKGGGGIRCMTLPLDREVVWDEG